MLKKKKKKEKKKCTQNWWKTLFHVCVYGTRIVIIVYGIPSSPNNYDGIVTFNLIIGDCWHLKYFWIHLAELQIFFLVMIVMWSFLIDFPSNHFEKCHLHERIIAWLQRNISFGRNILFVMCIFHRNLIGSIFEMSISQWQRLIDLVQWHFKLRTKLFKAKWFHWNSQAITFTIPFA